MKARLGAQLVVALLVLVGCGAEVHVGTKPDELDGATIASRANAQLEQQNPKLAHGDLTCDDVPYDVGASSRCVRTIVLKDGRVVRIGASVTIDKVSDGGHFTVKVDDAPSEFGLTGASVLRVLTQRYAAKHGGTSPTGSCPPYLAGKVGTTMTCRLTFPDGTLAVRVTVTTVDPRTLGTGFTYKTVG